MDKSLLMAYESGCNAFHQKLSFKDNPFHLYSDKMVLWYEWFCDEESEHILSLKSDNFE